MKAIGVTRYLPTEDPDCFVEKDIEKPAAAGRDLLVEVKAVSVNPVDTKIRKSKANDGTFRILGWDVSGTVVETGQDCSFFRKGDDVYFSGNISKNGANSEFHAVDERIVGRKPKSLNHAQAAALPLTTLTAWEAMFERMSISTDPEVNRGRNILLIGSAGGVGSIASQLASHAGLGVLGTASRPDSVEWAKNHGVDVTLDRKKDLNSQLEGLGMDYVDYIFCMNSIEEHWESIVKMVAPLGRICSIVSSRENLDLKGLWSKSASFSWESMSARPNFRTADMVKQHEILDTVADLVDAGHIRSTLKENLGRINRENLAKAHSKIESGSTIGKVVMEGF